MIRAAALACVLAAACYRPSDRACAVACDHLSAPACPDGLTCGTDDRCAHHAGECALADAAAPTDVPAPFHDGGDCFTGQAGSLVAMLCAQVGGMRVLPPHIDTTAGSTDCDPQSNGSQYCYISGDSLSVANDVSVSGTRPLVLVARGEIVVNADLDASSYHAAANPGPGANDTTCSMQTGGSSESDAGGGGAGGTFQDVGGAGGGTAAAGQGGGAAAPVGPRPGRVRGGCPGGDGGQFIGVGGLGGASGGGLYLAAGQKITITDSGAVLASGAGGLTPVKGQAGGGAGGAGGMIGLDAPTIAIISGGIVVANGGGGGAGAPPGSSGQEPDGLERAPGGAALAASGAGTGGPGSQGGDGSAGSPGTLGGAGTSAGGGGGGGGGAGYIFWFSQTPIDTTDCSPQPTT